MASPSTTTSAGKTVPGFSKYSSTLDPATTISSAQGSHVKGEYEHQGSAGDGLRRIHQASGGIHAGTNEGDTTKFLEEEGSAYLSFRDFEDPAQETAGTEREEKASHALTKIEKRLQKAGRPVRVRE